MINPECIKAWPECEEGKYDPRCCRFPKSCSCTINEGERVAKALRKIDIKDFALRVETLCNFLIAKYEREIGRDGSDDLKILEDLKNDAADIHMDNAQIAVETLSGLSEYMKGGTL